MSRQAAALSLPCHACWPLLPARAFPKIFSTQGTPLAVQDSCLAQPGAPTLIPSSLIGRTGIRCGSGNRGCLSPFLGLPWVLLPVIPPPPGTDLTYTAGGKFFLPCQIFQVQQTSSANHDGLGRGALKNHLQHKSLAE